MAQELESIEDLILRHQGRDAYDVWMGIRTEPPSPSLPVASQLQLPMVTNTSAAPSENVPQAVTSSSVQFPAPPSAKVLSITTYTSRYALLAAAIHESLDEYETAKGPLLWHGLPQRLHAILDKTNLRLERAGLFDLLKILPAGVLDKIFEYTFTLPYGSVLCSTYEGSLARGLTGNDQACEMVRGCAVPGLCTGFAFTGRSVPINLLYENASDNIGLQRQHEWTRVSEVTCLPNYVFYVDPSLQGITAAQQFMRHHTSFIWNLKAVIVRHASPDLWLTDDDYAVFGRILEVRSRRRNIQTTPGPGQATNVLTRLILLGRDVQMQPTTAYRLELKYGTAAGGQFHCFQHAIGTTNKGVQFITYEDVMQTQPSNAARRSTFEQEMVDKVHQDRAHGQGFLTYRPVSVSKIHGLGMSNAWLPTPPG